MDRNPRPACSGISGRHGPEYAIKLLCDLARQYNGGNNGDLCASISVLRPHGWNSPDTLKHALLELRHFGFLKLTRQGGLNCASLYAVTWHAIDDCKGKLECASTIVPSGDWKEPRVPYKRPKKNRKPSTETVVTRYGNRTSERKRAA